MSQRYYSYNALDSLSLKLVCEELKEVTYKWSKIGVQLGIPKYKLKEFKKEDDPLGEAVDYWLIGNVEGVPVSWRSVVEVLKSSGETGLAKRIKKKYCQQQDNVGGNGQALFNVFMMQQYSCMNELCCRFLMCRFSDFSGS